MQIKDKFETEAEFNSLLEQAEENATNDYEMKFVDDLTWRVKQYGMETYITENQFELLSKIARSE